MTKVGVEKRQKHPRGSDSSKNPYIQQTPGGISQHCRYKGQHVESRAKLRKEYGTLPGHRRDVSLQIVKT